MKPLLPTLRQKKRYVAYEVISKNVLSFDKIKENILMSIKTLFGESGLSNLNIIFVTGENNKGIIKTKRDCVDKLKAALAMVKKIDSTQVIIRTNYVSGVLKKVKCLI